METAQRNAGPFWVRWNSARRYCMADRSGTCGGVDLAVPDDLQDHLFRPPFHAHRFGRRVLHALRVQICGDGCQRVILAPQCDIRLTTFIRSGPGITRLPSAVLKPKANCPAQRSPESRRRSRLSRVRERMSSISMPATALRIEITICPTGNSNRGSSRRCRWRRLASARHRRGTRCPGRYDPAGRREGRPTSSPLAAGSAAAFSSHVPPTHGHVGPRITEAQAQNRDLLYVRGDSKFSDSTGLQESEVDLHLAVIGHRCRVEAQNGVCP